MKKVSVILISVAVICVVSAFASAQTSDTRWFSDAGAAADTFKISTAEELAGLAQLVNGGNDFRGKTVMLVDDIDLTNWGGWPKIGTVIGIGDPMLLDDDVLIPFSGTFDGNGKIVKRLTMYDYSDFFYHGLFGCVLNGVVKNVGVVDLDIDAYKYAGGVVAYLVNGTVDNCYTTGSGDYAGMISEVGGGVVGSAVRSTVINCYSSVRVWGGAGSNIGGVVGQAIDGSHIINCYSTGDVGSYHRDCRHGTTYCLESEDPYHVGGVVGFVNDGIVANCYSTGTIEGSQIIGGVVGYIEKGSVKNCVALNPSVYARQYYYAADGRWLQRQSGRVVGNEFFGDTEQKQSNETGYTLAGNFAFGKMDGGFSGFRGETTVNGADITIDEILADSGALDRIFTEENGWTKEAGKLPGLRGESVDIPKHLYKTDAVAAHNREIPAINPKADVAAVITPLNKQTVEFVAGPNPAGKQYGAVNLYFSGKRLKSGELAVYDASGNLINRVKIEDRGSAAIQERRGIGSWDMKDRKGRPVPKGTYLITGTVTAAAGGRGEKVSAAVGVR
jgi:hypothetical protein